MNTHARFVLHAGRAFATPYQRQSPTARVLRPAARTPHRAAGDAGQQPGEGRAVFLVGVKRVALEALLGLRRDRRSRASSQQQSPALAAYRFLPLSLLALTLTRCHPPSVAAGPRPGWADDYSGAHAPISKRQRCRWSCRCKMSAYVISSPHHSFHCRPLERLTLTGVRILGRSPVFFTPSHQPTTSST